MPVEGRRRRVAPMAAALHKRAAVPNLLRTRAEEARKAAAVAALRTRAGHCIAAERHRALVHKLAERHRPAAAARRALLDKEPAGGRPVPSGRRQARWGRVALLLL